MPVPWYNPNVSQDDQERRREMAYRIGKIQKTQAYSESIGASNEINIALYGVASILDYDGVGLHHKILVPNVPGGTVTLGVANTLVNTLNGGLVTAASISSGGVVINGENIGAVTVLLNDSNSALRNAINAKTGDTGVVATLNELNQLLLTSSSGADIVITGTTPGKGTGLDLVTKTAFAPVATLTAAGVMSTGDLNTPAYKYSRVSASTADASSFTVVSFSSLIPSP